MPEVFFPSANFSCRQGESTSKRGLVADKRAKKWLFCPVLPFSALIHGVKQGVIGLKPTRLAPETAQIAASLSEMYPRRLCHVIISVHGHLLRVRPLVLAKAKRPEVLPPALIFWKIFGTLPFDESSFQHLVVTQPQIRNIRRAKPQYVLQRTAYFPQPEIDTDAFQEIDQ
jgi:hypothetical protein